MTFYLFLCWEATTKYGHSNFRFINFENIISIQNLFISGGTEQFITLDQRLIFISKNKISSWSKQISQDIYKSEFQLTLSSLKRYVDGILVFVKYTLT